MDISPLLTEVKAQLHEEADYKQEAKYLRAFVEGLGSDERFLLPRVITSLSGSRVLGLTYVEGVAIEEVADEDQEERDRVMSLLFELLLIELFELGLVQTDPNFANYRYNPETGQVVLLDFGASKYFPDTFTTAYLDLLASAIEGDRMGMAAAAETAGYSLGPEGSPYREIVLDLLQLALEPISCGEAYDFGESTLPMRLANMGQQIQGNKEYWEVPPMYAAYIHRKIAGLFLLASRLKARVNIHELVLPWLD
jgi:predicted unusual protein kinase regulating ubiquinone biosynthesis (AarF/ABC1/UbiB family)